MLRRRPDPLLLMPAGNRAAKTAALGVFAALSVIFLGLAGFLPTGRLGFYVLCALCLGCVWHTSGLRAALIVALSAALLGALILPNKLLVLPYALFAAPHALVWCAAAKRPRGVRWAVKGALFALFGILVFGGIGWIERAFAWQSPIPDWAVALLVAAAMPLYDVVYGGVLRVLIRRLEGFLHSRGNG